MYDINNFGQELRLHEHASLKELAFAPSNVADFGQVYAKAAGLFYKEGGSSTENQVQYNSAVLDEVKDLSFTTAGQIIVRGAAALEVQSGDTARLSLGLGSTDSVIFNDITVEDMAVNGTLTTVNETNLEITNLYILVNSGETGAGITHVDKRAGIEVERGTLDNYLIVFDETDDNLQAGVDGAMNTVAFRADTLDDTGITFWDSASSKIITDADFKIDTANTRLYVGAQYIDATKIIAWDSGTGSSYTAGLNIDAAEIALGNIATVGSPEFTGLTISGLAGSIAVIGVTAGGSLSDSVTSDHLTEGSTNLYRGGANQAALESDYGVNFFDRINDDADSISEGATHFFRSGGDAAALLADYAVDTSGFISDGDLFGLTPGAGLSIDTAGTYNPEGSASVISMDLAAYFDNSDVILGVGIEWDAPTDKLNVDMTAFTSSGASATNTSAVLLKNGDLIVDIDDLNIPTALNGWTIITDDSSNTATAEQAEDTLRFSDGDGMSIAVTDVGNNAQAKFTVKAAVSHNTAIPTGSSALTIGDSIYKSIIMDYYYVNSADYQEGTIRVMNIGGSYQFTHEYQSTTDMHFTIDSIIENVDVIELNYTNNHAAAGSMTWIYRGVVA